MSSNSFFISLSAMMICVHLLRFPHLILENGGGAFLILYFVLLNVLALPLLVAEKVLDNKLGKISIRSLISVQKGKAVGLYDQAFVASWFFLRILGLMSFLWFFLYLGSSSFLYMCYFLKISFQPESATLDLPSVPTFRYSLIAALVWCSLSFVIYLRGGTKLLDWMGRYILPPSFLILFVLFVKSLGEFSSFEALKTLFYPDFSALRASSLSALVGHSLVSLFIGFGFYGLLTRTSKDFDFVEMFIRALIQCLILAIVIGVVALPMIEQISETPFGTTWLFEILPRWLSYGVFGHYYSSLFFLVICLLSIQLCVALYFAIKNNMDSLFKVKNASNFQTAINLGFVLLNSVVVVLMQKNLGGWSGQSLLLKFDHWIINVLVPIYSLTMIWMIFRYTKKHERELVFSHQQIFFHDRFFYVIWEKLSLWIVPSIILLGWFFLIIGN